MTHNRENTEKITDPMQTLCDAVRRLSESGNFEKCKELISDAMADNPDAPQPHNLLGIVLEKEGNHTEAMKHFRAAWDLDSTYAPAQKNLDHYGTFYAKGQCAYDENDCIDNEETSAVEFNKKGIGHIIRKEQRGI